jgi:hypothetical protein
MHFLNFVELHTRLIISALFLALLQSTAYSQCNSGEVEVQFVLEPMLGAMKSIGNFTLKLQAVAMRQSFPEGMPRKSAAQVVVSKMPPAAMVTKTMSSSNLTRYALKSGLRYRCSTLMITGMEVLPFKCMKTAAS